MKWINKKPSDLSLDPDHKIRLNLAKYLKPVYDIITDHDIQNDWPIVNR